MAAHLRQRAPRNGKMAEVIAAASARIALGNVSRHRRRGAPDLGGKTELLARWQLLGELAAHRDEVHGALPHDEVPIVARLHLTRLLKDAPIFQQPLPRASSLRRTGHHFFCARRPISLPFPPNPHSPSRDSPFPFAHSHGRRAVGRQGGGAELLTARAPRGTLHHARAFFSRATDARRLVIPDRRAWAAGSRRA